MKPYGGSGQQNAFAAKLARRAPFVDALSFVFRGTLRASELKWQQIGLSVKVTRPTADMSVLRAKRCSPCQLGVTAKASCGRACWDRGSGSFKGFTAFFFEDLLTTVVVRSRRCLFPTVSGPLTVGMRQQEPHQRAETPDTEPRGTPGFLWGGGPLSLLLSPLMCVALETNSSSEHTHHAVITHTSKASERCLTLPR